MHKMAQKNIPPFFVHFVWLLHPISERSTSSIEQGYVERQLNAPALRSEDEAARRAPRCARRLETWQILEGVEMERAVRGGASGMSNGGWFNRWGDTARGGLGS